MCVVQCVDRIAQRLSDVPLLTADCTADSNPLVPAEGPSLECMEPETTPSQQFTDSGVDEAGLAEVIAVDRPALPARPLSPVSRSTSSASPRIQDAEEQITVSIETERETTAETLNTPAQTTTSDFTGQRQPEQQSIEADVSEILVPSQSQREDSAADVQVFQPEDQSHGAYPATVAAQSVVAAQTGIPQEGAETANVAAEQLPSSAVQPTSDEPSVSGQEQKAEAAFAHATFVVPTENWKHLQIVPLATTAAEIKHSLCSNWNISETALSVKYNRQELKDNQSLASCGIQVWTAPPCSCSACCAMQAILSDQIIAHVASCTV